MSLGERGRVLPYLTLKGTYSNSKIFQSHSLRTKSPTYQEKDRPPLHGTAWKLFILLCSIPHTHCYVGGIKAKAEWLVCSRMMLCYGKMQCSMVMPSEGKERRHTH